MARGQQRFDVSFDSEYDVPQHVEDAAEQKHENADETPIVTGRQGGGPRRRWSAASKHQRRRRRSGHRKKARVERSMPWREEGPQLGPVDVRPYVEVGAALKQHAEARDQHVVARAVRRGDGTPVDVRDDGAHIENIEPSFIARPMSPLTLSFPDMNNICPDCLPDSMSSQSCAAIESVRLGFVAAPGVTVQVPSLITAFQVPPPSPVTSYWIGSFVPDALSGRNLLPIAANVSCTVGIVAPPLYVL